MKNNQDIIAWLIIVLLLAIQNLITDECPDLLTDHSDSESD